MELNIFNDIPKDKSVDIDVSNFIKELSKEVNKNELKTFTIKDIKIDEDSTLNFVNNIAKNNKMSNEDREELFHQERMSIFDIYDKNKKAGDLYYVVDNGTNDNLNVFITNNDVRDKQFEMIKRADFPENVKPGEIYRKKKDGSFELNKEETKEHERKMKSIAKSILNNQEKEGGYKREYTKNDLNLGDGYEDLYFEYPLYVNEKLGKEAGLPETMINDFLENDISKVFEDVAKKLSGGKTIYTVFPKERFTLYEISNEQVKKCDIKNHDVWEDFGKILINDKSKGLIEDKKITETFEKELLKELKSKVKPIYDKICEDYKKEGHFYKVEKALDENFTPTITLEDISQNRFFELEDLDFIKNRYAGEGTYVVKSGEYYKINKNEKIPKNHTIDKEKEDNKNISNSMAKKYNIPKEDIENMMKELMIETSKEKGVVVYVGYDIKKDQYYMDYYMEGKFDEREIISKKEADNMEVGTFSTMGRDEFNRYSDFFDAYYMKNDLEDMIKKSIRNK